jgi:hypothetical protein
VAERKAAPRRPAPSRSRPKAARQPDPVEEPGKDPVQETVAAIRAEHPSCNVAFCPVCLLVTTIGDIRPELVEHLLLAGRELLLAARSVIDARLEAMEEEEPGKSGLERISIE